MRTQRTQLIGNRTGRVSRTAVAHKDPNFDYAFKHREDIEDGTAEHEGWDVVRGPNRKESWHNPFTKKLDRTKGTGQMVLQDTVLCKRSKEDSVAAKAAENAKYNAQMEFVKNASRNANLAFREAGINARVEDHSKYTQKNGPTEGALNG